MQRIEKQLSDLGASLALTQAKVDEVHQRSRSVAPAEFSYTRPVTRSVSAHPEATALIEVQRVLNQMLPRVIALEQYQQETLPRLGALEQHQEELQQHQEELQQQQHEQQQQQNTADETNSSTTGDVQVAQSSPAQPIKQQQQQNPETSPRVPETHPNSSQQIASPQPPWSQLFDRRDDDDDRLAALGQQAVQSQQMTQHSADSDELREADHAHGNDSPQLFAELVALLGEARTLAGRNAHTQPHLRSKLEELGRFAHAANVAAFDTSRAWCRALLYFHRPAAADGQQQLDPRQLVSDVADLAGWAGERRRACDVSVPPVLDDFLAVSAAGKRAAAAADAEPARAAMLAEYERLRDVLVARVLTRSGGRGR
ncbi:hypothetical protein BFW01_g1767 [Lasiodiplodia theobromae]|nr:hypothetical protein BFW01_g1767 [Lasiodiplodia theobromae]